MPPLVERGLYCNHLVHPLVCPSVHLSIRSHFRNRYLSFYWKKWFYIWYMALAWWLVLCLPFPGLPHIYFLFTVRLRIFHGCRNENFRNSYPSFYWKKWFCIRYMALAWWLVPCLPFPDLPHIYFLFTVWLTNERVGVFLARLSVQHLVESGVKHYNPNPLKGYKCYWNWESRFFCLPVYLYNVKINNSYLFLSVWVNTYILSQCGIKYIMHVNIMSQLLNILM